MTPLERQKSIAVAFVSAISFKQKPRIEEQYDAWLLTEEGKRLTAEEPTPVPEPAKTSLDALIKIAESMVLLSEHQLVIKRQLDRIEGSMKFEPKE